MTQVEPKRPEIASGIARPSQGKIQTKAADRPTVIVRILASFLPGWRISEAPTRMNERERSVKKAMER